MLIGAGALGFLPGALIGIPLIVYATIPYWRLAYNQFVHQRRIGFSVVLAILMTGVLGSGQFLVHTFLLTLNNLAYLVQTYTYLTSKASLTDLVNNLP